MQVAEVIDTAGVEAAAPTDVGAGDSDRERPATTGRERRAGRPRDARASRAITEAALRQLFDVGYANMSMESVAGEAGVARATVYRRFQDKADLITSAIATGVEGPQTTGEPLVDLVSFLEGLDTRFSESCLEVIGCLLGSRTDPSAMALHRDRVVGPQRRALVALASRAKEAGLLRQDTDLDLFAEMLVGVVFARRIMGVRSDAGWAVRAVEAACAGAATAAGLAHIRQAPRVAKRRQAELAPLGRETSASSASSR